MALSCLGHWDWQTGFVSEVSSRTHLARGHRRQGGPRAGWGGAGREQHTFEVLPSTDMKQGLLSVGIGGRESRSGCLDVEKGESCTQPPSGKARTPPKQGPLVTQPEPLPTCPADCSITKFLNRILGLEVHKQNALFQYFSDTFDHLIEMDKKEGKYDMGILGEGHSGGSAGDGPCSIVPAPAPLSYQTERLRPCPGSPHPHRPPGGPCRCRTWGTMKTPGRGGAIVLSCAWGTTGSPSRVSPKDWRVLFRCEARTGMLSVMVVSPARLLSLPHKPGPHQEQRAERLQTLLKEASVSIFRFGGQCLSVQLGPGSESTHYWEINGRGHVPIKLYSSNQWQV